MLKVCAISSHHDLGNGCSAVLSGVGTTNNPMRQSALEEHLAVKSGEVTEEEQQKILAAHERFLSLSSKRRGSADVRNEPAPAPSTTTRVSNVSARRRRSSHQDGSVERFGVVKHHRVRGRLQRVLEIRDDTITTLNQKSGKQTNVWLAIDVIEVQRDTKDVASILITVRRGVVHETMRFSMASDLEQQSGRLLSSLEAFCERKQAARTLRSTTQKSRGSKPVLTIGSGGGGGGLLRTARFGPDGKIVASPPSKRPVSVAAALGSLGTHLGKKRFGRRFSHAESLNFNLDELDDHLGASKEDENSGGSDAAVDALPSTRAIIDAKLASGKITSEEHARISDALTAGSVLNAWSAVQQGVSATTGQAISPRSDKVTSETLAYMMDPKRDKQLTRRKHRRATQDVTKITEMFAEKALLKEEHMRGQREQHRARMAKKRAQREAAREIAMRRYSALDLNGNGLLDRDEFEQALPQMPTEESTALFDSHVAAGADSLTQRAMVKVLLTLEEKHLVWIDQLVAQREAAKEAAPPAPPVHNAEAPAAAPTTTTTMTSHEMKLKLLSEEDVLQKTIARLEGEAEEREEEMAQLRRSAQLQEQVRAHDLRIAAAKDDASAADALHESEMHIQILRLTESNMELALDVERARKRFDVFEREAVAEVSALEMACQDRLGQVKLLTQEKNVALQDVRSLRLEIIGLRRHTEEQDSVMAFLDAGGLDQGGTSDEEDERWLASGRQTQPAPQAETRELLLEREQLREQLRNCLEAVAAAQLDRDEKVSLAARELIEIRNAMHLQMMRAHAPDHQTALSMASEIDNLRLSLGWKLRLLEDAMSRNQHELLLATMEKETALARLADHGRGSSSGSDSESGGRVEERVLSSKEVNALLERLVHQRLQVKVSPSSPSHRSGAAAAWSSPPR